MPYSNQKQKIYMQKRRLKKKAEKTHIAKTAYERSKQRQNILSSIDALVEKAFKEAIFFEMKTAQNPTELLDAKICKNKENLSLRLESWRSNMNHLKEEGYSFTVSSMACGKMYLQQTEFMNPLDYRYKPLNLYDVGYGKQLNKKFVLAVKDKPEFNEVVVWREKELDLSEALETVNVSNSVALREYVEQVRQAEIQIVNDLYANRHIEDIKSDVTCEMWDALNYSMEGYGAVLVDVIKNKFDREKQDHDVKESINSHAEQLKFDSEYPDRKLCGTISEQVVYEEKVVRLKPNWLDDN